MSRPRPASPDCRRAERLSTTLGMGVRTYRTRMVVTDEVPGVAVLDDTVGALSPYVLEGGAASGPAGGVLDEERVTAV